MTSDDVDEINDRLYATVASWTDDWLTRLIAELCAAFDRFGPPLKDELTTTERDPTPASNNCARRWRDGCYTGRPMTLRFDDHHRVQFRADLMTRGMHLATLLSDVLSGKRPPSLEALLAAKPGKRPEEVLRLALDQVEARRHLIDADDDRFGRCDICGVDLGEVVLGEMAWADRCEEHSARSL